MQPLMLGVIVVTALVTMRVVAARRVAAGDGRFVWVVFAPLLVVGAAMIWAAWRLMPETPMIGAVVGIAGSLYLASAIRVTVRSTRRIDTARTPDDIADAITGPMTDHMIVWMSLTLIGGLVAVAVLIVWGISRAAG